MILLRWHTDFVMLTRTVYCFAVERGHHAADHGHGAPDLYDLAVDAYCCTYEGQLGN